MKKVLLLLTIAMGCLSLSNATTKAEIKEHKAEVKQSKAELTERATKAARKESKKLIKEGWTVTAGTLPLEKQLDRSYMMQYEFDETGYSKYIMSEAMSIGENYDAAKMQALELAKQNMAGMIESQINAIIENTVANKQLTAEQAASVTQSVSASKNLIIQRMGRVVPVVECYRVKSNKNKEVLVRLAYNSKMAMESAKQAIREDLEAKGNELHKQLDQVLGF